MLSFVSLVGLIAPCAVAWKLVLIPIEAVLRAVGALNAAARLDVELSERVVIVTGANTGIGKRTALHLARMGAKVIMACRSVQKGEDARAEVEQEIRDGSATTSDRGPAGSSADTDASAGRVSRTSTAGTLEVMHLDLADLESVRAFATEFKAKQSRLDVLVNNAGMYQSKGMTKDGLDAVFGVNFVGPFVLTLELLPLIQSTPNARVVGLSSVAHHAGRTHWEDAAGGRRGYFGLLSYCDSKLAMILFAKELRRRFAAVGSSATAFAVNPGAVRSDLFRFLPSLLQPIFGLLARLFLLDVDEGCRPSVCTSALPLSSLSGSDYYQPYWLPFGWPFPSELLGVYVGCAPAKPSLPKNEAATSAELWTACERIVKAADSARCGVR